MQAFVHDAYGPPGSLELRDVVMPQLADDGVLVRVHATSVNPVDWHTLTGTPYVARIGTGLRGPKDPLLGVDFAGTVEEVGKDVTTFKPGDEVFGGRSGAFAEYVRVSAERAVVAKPAGIGFDEAAAVPVAALTALQGLRDKGRLRAGQKVLVNGASGGVGTFAVQIAKALGANVTAVCSTRNVDTARSIGADRVVDYTQEDFTRADERYDLLLDIAGSHSWAEYRRVLADNATLVVVGGPKGNAWLGPLAHLAKMRVTSLGGGRRLVVFLARVTKADLLVVAEMLESGEVKSVLDRRYERLSDIPKALAYLGEGHARGKVVVSAAVEPHQASDA